MADYESETTQFDTYNGHQIEKFTIKNPHGVTLSAINLGATLYELSVPTAEGQKNMVLNYEHSADYYENPFYVNMGIGRTGGRIGQGMLKLHQGLFKVPANEGQNTLHGGPHGFNTKVWQGRIDDSGAMPEIIFTTEMKRPEDGFPGDLKAEIRYALNEDDRAVVTFKGTADAESVFNPTLHTYFNLSDQDDILNHELQINAAEHLDFDTEKIPTGRLLSVADTPFDFREPQLLGKAIEAMADTPEKGFDDVFRVQGDRDHKIATLTDDDSGRSVDIISRRNGLVVFTANSFTKDHMNFVRTNGVGKPHLGVALEAQGLPDSTKYPKFGSEIIEKNETKTFEIGYQLHY